MANILKGLKPQRVFEIFEDICAIPHGSGNTKAISDYCVAFAKERDLWVFQDELNNVIIKKAASEGYENHSPVIIQGHLDMVCEKEPECDIDFLHDGLRLRVDDDFISAEGTTLGADDGVAVAMALSIAEDNTLCHPPLEILFTVDEETGMYGAEGLDATLLSGKRFINIDSDHEGMITVGCAGGARAEIDIPLIEGEITAPCYSVEVGGLMGGHSGGDINKGRLNSNVVMGRLLSSLDGDYNIIDIAGGLKDNAIPALTKCIVSTDCDIKSIASAFESQNKISTDSGLYVKVEPAEKTARGFTHESSVTIAKFLSTVPNGIQAMSTYMEDLVETSLNLGILKIEKNTLHASFAVRSSVGEEKLKLLEKLSEFSKKIGANYNSHSHYPAWEYRESSPLRDIFTSVFARVYEKKLIVRATHGGLECGLFSEKIEDIDAVSFGPDVFDIHTPRERMSISSTARTYDYLCEVLKEL